MGAKNRRKQMHADQMKGAKNRRKEEPDTMHADKMNG